MDELKEFFSTNGMTFNNQTEVKWRELKIKLQEAGHKVGSVRCGSCRRTMLRILNSI